MPFYDYYCEKNDQTVEVFHDMQTKLKTWGEVCQLAEKDLGGTPAKTSVVRLISGVTPKVFKVKGLDKDAPSDRLEL